ncbi:MAG: hypothetical protein QM719_07450 [Thermomonas sp.]
MNRDGRRDFDFLHGHWRVRNERLRERLASCTDWECFESSVDCHPVLGGGGNLETHESDWNGGYRGLALRLYSPATRRWSIHWASDRNGELEPPVHGGFDGTVGAFVGEDRHQGRLVRVRFLWTRIDADHARWEQAFSTDNGAHWETNWFMHFTREGAPQ